MHRPQSLDVGSIIVLQDWGLERFHVREVREGGMGEVYRLDPLQAGAKSKALKTFNIAGSESDFLRECQAWIMLSSHPNIARALTFGRLKERPYILSDWYEFNATSICANDWTEDKLLGFAAELVAALEFAYEKGVLHLDIKPSNILLDEKARPRLSDWGLARFARASTAKLTSVMEVSGELVHAVSIGPVGGTPLYMAPELLGGTGRPGVLTEIYSLGVTLYEIITGGHPYIGAETGWRYKPQFRLDPLSKALGRRGHNGALLLKVIAGCASIDPINRPPSFDAVSAMLGGCGAICDVSEVDDVQRVVAEARMHRAEGRSKEAGALLVEHLRRYPENPVLVNAVGVGFLHAGLTEVALRTFATGHEIMERKRGRYGGKLYLDPTMNLGRWAILTRRLDEAYRVLRSGWTWIRDQEGSARDHYNEFGWMMLYDRQFEAACEILWLHHQRRKPEPIGLIWFTLAAWYSGRFQEYADAAALTRDLLECLGAPPFQKHLMQCAMLLASKAPAHSREALFEALEAAASSEMRSLEQRLSLASGALPRHATADNLQSIVSELDDAVTGGRLRGCL